MPRMSKNHPMNGSLKRGEQYKEAQFVYDPKAQAYFVKDISAKKRYGPFLTVADAVRDGVYFYADNGRRASRTTAETVPVEA